MLGLRLNAVVHRAGGHGLTEIGAFIAERFDLVERPPLAEFSAAHAVAEFADGHPQGQS